MIGARAATLLALLLAPAARAQDAPPKVILDTDFNTISDDGQAFVMLAQLHAERRVDLLGLTVVTGNQWLDQGVADALKAVERMGVADRVPVVRGALHPLVHDFDTFPQEKALFGSGYAGAWNGPPPRAPADLVPPPDGLAEGARPHPARAADFIIDAVKANPREVTILAVGPATNLALAVREAPEIVPLIERIIWMGGAVDVSGNVTPAAEFNWWFDPEAAKIVLREPIPQLVVPLDVTDKTVFDKGVYDRIVSPAVPETAVTRLWRDAWGAEFARDPAATSFVWDTIAVALLADPSLATDVRVRFLDVDTVFGPDYGRSLGYVAEGDAAGGANLRPPAAGLRPVEVVYAIDQPRFWDLFVDLMTRPAPVRPAGR